MFAFKSIEIPNEPRRPRNGSPLILTLEVRYEQPSLFLPGVCKSRQPASRNIVMASRFWLFSWSRHRLHFNAGTISRGSHPIWTKPTLSLCVEASHGMAELVFIYTRK